MTSTLTSALRARNAYDIRRRYQICLIHPFDPRGEKVGGRSRIEVDGRQRETLGRLREERQVTAVRGSGKDESVLRA